MTDKQEGAPRTLEELKHTRTIDTIHQDEALKVLAQYAGDESWTPEEEKKLVRRLDRKLISLLVVTYGLQYYDKAMLSQAVSSLHERLSDSIADNVGSLRLARRPASEHRQPLLLLRLHLLPGLHCRQLPSNPHGAALADRACRIRHCCNLGSMLDV